MKKVDNLFRSCRKNRKGAAVVEFAVIAPLFFLLVFGMIEFGRTVMVQQLLTNATREGARKGVLTGTTDQQVRDTVKNYLAGTGITVTDSQVPVAHSTGSDGDETITVSVTVPFNQVTWLPTPIFLNGYSLSATSSMRVESVE